MALPASFAKDGFTPLAKAKFKRLMVGTDGPTDSGKSEFALSAPNPGVAICLDRGLEACLDNQQPPPTRGKNWAVKIIQAPLAQGALKDTYLEYWKLFRDDCYKVCANPDARTLFMDGDSDSWELQRLAEFGKLTQIPSIMYTGVNAARRLFYSRLYDSGKIIIATNKVKKHYANKYLPNGQPELQNDGKPAREWDGTFERQGFEDQDYLWQIQLHHITRLNKVGEKEYGIRLMKVKAAPYLVGQELWAGDCNFQSLVEFVYPQVSLAEWGF